MTTSKRIRLKIPVEPAPKGRPRVTFSNGKVRTYTPDKTKAVQEEIAAHLYKHRDKAFQPFDPVKLTIIFYRRRSRWNPKGETLPVRKPDIDNFVKMVLDSANGILFADDAQITKLIASKRWADNGNTKAEGYITIDMELDS